MEHLKAYFSQIFSLYFCDIFFYYCFIKPIFHHQNRRTTKKKTLSNNLFFENVVFHLAQVLFIVIFLLENR
jgi:hypothetical protein